MTKSEILKALESLSPAERQEIRGRIDELNDEEEDWDDVPPAQRDLILARLAEMEKNPGRGIPWAEAEKELMARYRK